MKKHMLTMYNFRMLLDEWKKGCKNKKDKKEMDGFIKKNFQDWCKW